MLVGTHRLAGKYYLSNMIKEQNEKISRSDRRSW